jgi:hypothetical protein
MGTAVWGFGPISGAAISTATPRFVGCRTDRRADQADAAMRMREFPLVLRVGFVRTLTGLQRTTRRSSMAFLADVSPSADPGHQIAAAS